MGLELLLREGKEAVLAHRTLLLVDVGLKQGRGGGEKRCGLIERARNICRERKRSLWWLAIYLLQPHCLYTYKSSTSFIKIYSDKIQVYSTGDTNLSTSLKGNCYRRCVVGYIAD